MLLLLTLASFHLYGSLAVSKAVDQFFKITATSLLMLRIVTIRVGINQVSLITFQYFYFHISFINV